MRPDRFRRPAGMDVTCAGNVVVFRPHPDFAVQGVCVVSGFRVILERRQIDGADQWLARQEQEERARFGAPWIDTRL